MKVYKVLNLNNDWVAFKDKKDAETQLKFEEEMDLDSGGEDKFRIEECEMTEEEYKNLPEWEGF